MKLYVHGMNRKSSSEASCTIMAPSVVPSQLWHLVPWRRQRRQTLSGQGIACLCCWQLSQLYRLWEVSDSLDDCDSEVGKEWDVLYKICKYVVVIQARISSRDSSTYQVEKVSYLKDRQTELLLVKLHKGKRANHP